MNHVIAQGAPNSLIRHFQDHPQHAVDLFEAARVALVVLNLIDGGNLALRERLRKAVMDVRIARRQPVICVCGTAD